MPSSVTARNASSAAVGALGGWLSLHTTNPGTTGAGEGSTSRAQTTWAAPSGGSIVGTQQDIPVPAGTYGWFATWTAASGGTFLTGGALTVAEVFAGPGIYQLTPTITST